MACGGGVESGLDEQDLVERQRLKAALHYTVGKVCECVSNTDSDNVIISKDVMVAMTELVMQQTATLAIDLELFAKHAKRTTITTDDLKLSCRHSPTLLQYISNEIDTLKKEKTQADEEKKKKRDKKILIDDD